MTDDDNDDDDDSTDEEQGNEGEEGQSVYDGSVGSNTIPSKGCQIYGKCVLILNYDNCCV